MKYLYWICAALVIGSGVYFAMNFTPQPQVTAAIEFSQVDTPEQFGQMVYERLQEELKNSPVVFWGVTPNHIEDMELVRGFMEANTAEGSKYDFVVLEPQLPYVELFNASNLRVDTKNEMLRLVEGIKGSLADGHRVIAVVPSIYSSKLLRNNPADRLQKEFGLEFTSFSITKFPSTREQEEEFEPRCVRDSDKDPSGQGPLGCMIQQLSRKTYRKKIENNKYSGLMEMTGLNDYVILFNRNPAAR